MPLDPERVKVEYEKQNVPKDMQDSMLQVALLLTNIDKMNGYLAKLDQKMQELYAKRTSSTASLETTKTAVKALTKAVRPADDPSRHLLSTVLTLNEEANKFKLYVSSLTGHPLDAKNPAKRPIAMTGALSNEGFKAHLQQGEQAKDYVTIPHGVYTHRIQWFCICQAWNVDVTFSGSVVDFYSRFYEGGSWFVTFDKTPNPEFPLLKDDFRNPEYLNTYLSQGNQFPLLTGYLRSKKEGTKFPVYSRNVMRVIVAKKMFGLEFPGWKLITNDNEREEMLAKKLSAEQRKTLDEYFGIKSGNDKNVLFPTSDGKFSNTNPNPPTKT